MMPKERCPELKVIRAGDEAGYICKLVDKWCLIETGYPCEEYETILKDMKEEEL